MAGYVSLLEKIQSLIGTMTYGYILDPFALLVRFFFFVCGSYTSWERQSEK
jgi:hypothetical protein